MTTALPLRPASCAETPDLAVHSADAQSTSFGKEAEINAQDR
jgi:hypothetical protein